MMEMVVIKTADRARRGRGQLQPSLRPGDVKSGSMKFEFDNRAESFRGSGFEPALDGEIVRADIHSDGRGFNHVIDAIKSKTVTDGLGKNRSVFENAVVGSGFVVSVILATPPTDQAVGRRQARCACRERQHGAEPG